MRYNPGKSAHIPQLPDVEIVYISLIYLKYIHDFLKYVYIYNPFSNYIYNSSNIHQKKSSFCIYSHQKQYLYPKFFTDHPDSLEHHLPWHDGTDLPTPYAYLSPHRRNK